MFRAIYRQRRRVMVSTFFFLLAIFLVLEDKIRATLQGENWAYGALYTLFFFSFVGLVIGGVVAVVTTFLPFIRRMAEVSAVFVFLATVSYQLIPSEFTSQHPGLLSLLYVVMSFSLLHLMYDRGLDRFPIRLISPSIRSFTSPRSAEQLWIELVPGVGDPEQFWQTNLSDITPTPEHPTTWKARFAVGGGAFVHRLFKIESMEFPHHCRYRYEDEVSPQNLPVNAGTVTITLTPSKNGTRVTFEDTPDAQLPRHALEDWMDDILGDEMDFIRARHLGKWDWTKTGREFRLAARLS